MSKQNYVKPMNVENVDSPDLQDETIPSVSHEIDMHHADDHSVLSFQNIHYTVKIKKAPFGVCRSKKSKEILRNIR